MSVGTMTIVSRKPTGRPAQSEVEEEEPFVDPIAPSEVNDIQS